MDYSALMKEKSSTMEVENLGDKIYDLNSISQENLDMVEILYNKMKETTNGNALYLYALQIFKICNIHNELPRLVVFGQQSMGKTTLLDFIMGGPMGYTSSDTGTKQPVVIILKPSETNKIECYVNKKKVDIDNLHDKMKTIMANLNDAIISKELEVEISIPGGIYATFVDLPGIKDDSKAGSELTRRIVRNYVQNFPNDIYILVKKASDDPANWPYNLREFILKPRPQGLGLQPKQSIVVGTRALEFLNNELSTIRTLSQLHERVKKRSITDKNECSHSLYLLELFSIPIEQKEKNDFITNRITMYSKILNGRKNVLDLLLKRFENDCSEEVKKELLDCFDVEKFKKEVNSKFMNILIQQLHKVEEKLEKKSAKIRMLNKKLEQLYNRGNILSIREQIRLYIRELVNIISNLLTGNYPILNLIDHGENFLQKYGGNLSENLNEGNEMAKELFGKKGTYDEKFLQKLNEHVSRSYRVHGSTSSVSVEYSQSAHHHINSMTGNTTNNLKHVHRINSLDGSSEFSSSSSKDGQENLNEQEKPEITDSGIATLSEGQCIRFTLAKEENNMFGILKNNGEKEGKKSKGLQALKGKIYSQGNKNMQVAFYFKSNNAMDEQVQVKMVERERIFPITPFISLSLEDFTMVSGTEAWYKMIRDDGWIGLDRVEIIKVLPHTIKYNSSSVNKHTSSSKTSPKATNSFHENELANDHYASLRSTMNNKSGSTSASTPNKGMLKEVVIKNLSKNNETMTVPIYELFVDYSQILQYTEIGIDNDEDILKKIAGAHSDLKILNQLSITNICKWLKFNIANIEPEKEFSDEVLLQMMRSIHNIVDQSDWKPLVVDLLQANISGNILSLTKLASCSASVALKRVFKAALSEINRKIRSIYMDETIYLICTSNKFLDDLSDTLNRFCTERAEICSNEMKAIVFEQTYAVHFEIIQEIFEGCKLFEDRFLTPYGVKPAMAGINKSVRQNLAYRNHQLSLTDVRINKNSKSKELLYEEVKLQFWAIKMLISVPLATKIYAHFLNNVLAKNKHLANMDYSIDCESFLERYLHEKLLHREINGTLVPIEENELLENYNILDNQEALLNKLENQRRLGEYFAMVSNSIKLLKAHVAKEGSLDFMTGINFVNEEKSMNYDQSTK